MTLAFALALLLAADAPASGGEAPVEVQPAAPAVEDTKLVCRRVPELGSRIRAQRVCMTKQQWAEQRQQNRQTIERAQMRSGACGSGSGC